jgi:2-keto-4-pentenoate hydratase
LREERGERWVGYKIGCIHPGLQAQLGLSEPVHANLWESERRLSGCTLARNQFLNLAIEAEFAATLGKSLSLEDPSTAEILAALDRVFPVIELHHYFFARGKPGRQELIASNALHAGVVAPSSKAAGSTNDGSTVSLSRI